MARPAVQREVADVPARARSVEALVSAAAELGATVVRSAGATVVVIPAPEPAADDLIPIGVAATIAKVQVRTLSDARRSGALTMYGGQRSRTIRRADLEKWIQSRRVRPLDGPDDDGMDRRIARIERVRAARERRSA